MRGDKALLSGFMLLIVALTPLIGTVASDPDYAMMGRASVKMAGLHIRVTYPGAGPAVGASVYVHNEGTHYDDFTVLKAFTNSSGECDLDINPFFLGPSIITVHDSNKSHFISESVYFGPGDTISRNITLERSMPYDVEVRGHVLDSSTGLPTPPVTEVYAYGYDIEGKEFLARNITDDSGHFILRVPFTIEAINVQVIVSNLSKSYKHYAAQVFLDKDWDPLNLSLELSQEEYLAAPVNLRFMDRTTGGPFQDPMMFSAIGKDGMMDHSDTSYSGTTTPFSSGWWNTSLPPGEYSLRCSHPMYWPHMNYISFTIPLFVNATGSNETQWIPLPDSMRQVNITFIDSKDLLPIPLVQCTFSYTVINSGCPDLIFSNMYILSNETGTASFGILPDTKVKVMASHWDHQGEEIIIQPGPATSGVKRTVDLVKYPPSIDLQGNISIVVRDGETKVPIPYANVRGELEPSGSTVSFYGQTNIYGFFNSSISAGTYTIDVSCPLGSGRSEDVLVSLGKNTSLAVDMDRRDFAPKGRWVEFDLVDPSGLPLAGKPIVITHGGGGDPYQLISDARGTVRAILIDGDYWLSNYDATYASSFRTHWIVPPRTRITVGPGEVIEDIVLYPALPLGEISGTVMDVDTKEPIPYTTILAESIIDLPGPTKENPFLPEEMVVYRQDVLSGQRGFFRVWGVGDIDLSFSAYGYFPLVETVGAPDTGHSVELERLEPYSTWVNGTLLDDEDVPIRGNVTLFDLFRGEFIANATETGNEGKFSLGIYPGTFRIEFHNLSLSGSMEITVPASGIEDLVLRLIAMSRISGTVKDRQGNLLKDINLTLQRIEDSDDHVQYIDHSWHVTGIFGDFHFEVPKGPYRIHFIGSDRYDPYEGGPLLISGWTDMDIEVVLEDRTSGTIRGVVTGNGAGVIEPIPGCTIVLKDGLGDNLSTTESSSMSGAFMFKDISLGTYSIEVSPPHDISANQRYYIDGYLPAATPRFALGSSIKEFNISLDYAIYSPPGNLLIRGFSPHGDGIPLNEPIRLWFSEPVNMTELPGAFSISPEVTNLTFVTSWDGSSVCIYHEEFERSVEYDVVLEPTFLSSKGYPLTVLIPALGTWVVGPFEWSFTTGTHSDAWNIYSSLITVHPNKNWTVEAVGPKGQEVHFIVDGIGSFELIESPRSNLTSYYLGSLEGELFNWSSLYFFHYSDDVDGLDMALEFSGFRMMPDLNVTPHPEWRLYNASVRLDEEGNWLVNVTGEANITVYIVIVNVSSFLLGQRNYGSYGTVIPFSVFIGGVVYSYHFSNVSAGPDLAPAFSGTLEALERDEGAENGKGISALALVLITLAMLLLTIAIAVFVITFLSRKGAKETPEEWGSEEEEEEWGME